MSGEIFRYVESVEMFRMLERHEKDLKVFLEEMHALRQEYESLGVIIDLSLGVGPSVCVNRIDVPKEKRNTGIATSFFERLTALSDEYGVILTLSPSDSFGSSVSRLTKFYKKFGFVPNKGRNKDYRFMYAMLREPKSLAE